MAREHTALRLEPDLRVRLQEASARNGRTISEEMRVRLAQSFRDYGQLVENEAPMFDAVFKALAYAAHMARLQRGMAPPYASFEVAAGVLIPALRPKDVKQSVDAKILGMMIAAGAAGEVESAVPGAYEKVTAIAKRTFEGGTDGR